MKPLSKVPTKKIDAIDQAICCLQAKGQRIACGVKMQALADTLGYSIGYISDLENGRRDWNETLYRRWLEACKKAKS